MTNDDMEGFTVAWGTAWEMQTGNELSDPAIKLAFRLLKDLDLLEVRKALATHCRKTHWKPSVSAILTIVDGELPSNTALYGLAVQNDTVLGRYIKSLMKGDMERLSEYDGLRRIEMIRGKIEDFHQRALVGDYTESELRMFVAAGLDPSGKLAQGVSGPRATYRQSVLDRALEVRSEPKIEQAPVEDMSEEQRMENKKMMAELLATLGARP